MRRLPSIILLAAAFVSAPAVARDAGRAFDKAPVADDALSSMRGGFALPGGVDVSVAVQSDTLVNGVLLPHVIRYNARATPDRFVALAAQAGLPVFGMPGEEAAELLAEHVRRLADDVGVPRGLRSLGVTEEDVPGLAVTTLGDACLSTNPRPASAADVEALFRAAL